MLIDFELIIVIFFVALLQSIFGVGVLLVGTPLLMLAGYSYFDVLSLTLPTSLIISLSQVVKYNKFIDLKLFKKAFPIVLTMISIGMYLAKYLGAYVGIIVGIFLFLISLKFVINAILPPHSSNKRVSLVIFLMSLIQGTTSLGGAILPSIVGQKCDTKEKKLATTAALYVLFQLTQITFLLLNKYQFDFSRTGMCVIIGFISYYLVGKNLFQAIKTEKYSKYLSIFICAVAILLVTYKIYKLN